MNDEESWRWVWKQYNDTGVFEIPSADCYDLIVEMSDLSEEEKDAILDEFPDEYDYICPNMTSFQVEGGKITPYEYLSLEIYMTYYGLENKVDEDSIIFTSMISRYFDAEKYT